MEMDLMDRLQKKYRKEKSNNTAERSWMIQVNGNSELFSTYSNN